MTVLKGNDQPVDGRYKGLHLLFSFMQNNRPMVQRSLAHQQHGLLLEDIAREATCLAFVIYPPRDLTRPSVQPNKLSRAFRRSPSISLVSGRDVGTVVRQWDCIFCTVSQTQVASLDHEDTRFVSDAFDAYTMYRRWR